MTKLEYLTALTKALSFLDHDARNAALDFCREALEDRIEETGNEEAAVAAMDAPEKIAADLRQEMAVPETAAPQPDADGLTDEWSVRTFECPAAKLHAVKLEAENMAIEVLPGEDSQARLTYYTRRQDVYTARLDRDVLTLTHRSDPSLTRRILRGLFYHPTPVKVTLLLPPDAALDLSAETRNGGVTVQGMRSLGILNMKSANGSLTVENAACGEAVLRTSNAPVTVRDTVCRGFLQVRTSNGSLRLLDSRMGNNAECVTCNASIRAENVYCDDTLRLETTNANVHAQGVRCAALSLRASNASLTVGDIQAESVSLRTSNGSIRGVLPGRQRDWKIDSGTSNGKNSLPASQPGEKPLSARTNNASIQITFEGGQ